jgi:hypothetical protein
MTVAETFLLRVIQRHDWVVFACMTENGVHRWWSAERGGITITAPTIAQLFDIWTMQPDILSAVFDVQMKKVEDH